MLKELIKYLEDKNIVILGFGREGKSMYRFLRKYFPEKQITISDQKDFFQYNEYLKKDFNLNYIIGDEYLNNLNNFDLIIKSPGISLKTIDKTNILNKITSQYELFLEFFDECETIGVTGTKGKSTTSTLINEILKNQKEDVKFLGNIGVPIFDEIESINKNTIVVLELSSHALELSRKSPKIAIMLNVFPEHLDYYNSYNDYVMAKYNIAKYQNENDYFIYNMDNLDMKNVKFKYKENDIKVSIKDSKPEKNKVYLSDDGIYLNDKKLMSTNIKLNLKGKHNLNNIMFALAVSEILELDLKKTIESIKNMKGLEHRLEYVGNIDGIEYYNDSISTVPESTIQGIEALKNVNTLIVGGNDRGINLKGLIEYLKKSDVENIICMSMTGKEIYEGLKNGKKNAIRVNYLEEAVKIAKQITVKNTICLLSPAASSYDQFKNFEERGDKFKQYVLEK
ncbi:MAG: UDP-N-acetylmuramoyl-L-alanine--D-glutamate ligase [Candidatus Scatovivens sp.]